MNEVAAILMTHEEEDHLAPLRAGTPVELLPFAGGAHVVDFTLMELTAADISPIVVPVPPGSGLLARHVRKRANRSAVRTPEVGQAPGPTAGDVLKTALRFLDNRTRQVVVCTGKNVHYLDLEAGLAHHRACGADATLMTLAIPSRDAWYPGQAEGGCGKGPKVAAPLDKRAGPLPFGLAVTEDLSGKVSAVRRTTLTTMETGEDSAGAESAALVADTLVVERPVLTDVLGKTGPILDFFDFLTALVSHVNVAVARMDFAGAADARHWYRPIGTISRYWTAHRHFLHHVQQDPSFLSRLTPRSVYVERGFDGKVTNAIVPRGFSLPGGRIRDAVIGGNVRMGRRVWIQEAVIHEEAEVDDGCTIRLGILARGARVTGRARLDPRRRRPGSQLVKQEGVTLVPRGVLVRGPAKIPRPGANLPLDIACARAASSA